MSSLPNIGESTQCVFVQVTAGSVLVNDTAPVTSTTSDPGPSNNVSSASFTALNKSDPFLTLGTK